MSNTQIFVCSFHSNVADLKAGKRTELDALRVLEKDPRVSCFDMSDIPWLENLITAMEKKGLIHNNHEEHYPWLKFAITEAGRQLLNGESK